MQPGLDESADAALRPQARQVKALRTVNRWQPAGAPGVATQLWLGVHLAGGLPAQTAGTSARTQAMPAGAPNPQHLLEPLALRAQRCSPRVSLVPPDGLLLEVKGSLHLFGGVAGLCDSLAGECAALGLTATLALAPTPLAAMVAARASPPGGARFIVLSVSQLVGRLAALPLTTLRWPPQTLGRLAHMGIRTIGQVLRLPRAGFARRFGTDPLLTLDRLTGRHADLRERFQARERFRCKRDFTYELENQQAILAALAPLLQELGSFLQQRQCGLLQLDCLLMHRHGPATHCRLRLAAPAADCNRLHQLLGERLNHLVLREPVRSCELRSGALIRSQQASNSLWQPGEHGGAPGVESPGLIESLRARLGPEAVYSLRVLTSHRPENAWSIAEPAGSGNARTAHQSIRTPWPPFCRPLWLLSAPQLLSKRGGLPRRRGPLRLLGDPERIETGWWDGGEIARDYYVAIDIRGVRLWVFRERAAPHHWFLHGVFG